MPKKKTTYNNLLIVESPAKAKTINKYLGKDFKVMATVGHIIDLPKSKLSVDVENDYEPVFETIYGKGKVIKELKTAVPKGGNVYLAMDPDREGEAIAWHVKNALNLKKPQRVTFNEITKDAVLEAVEKPTKIDDNLVQAQIARRVLDRLVGYKVSELIWKKVWYGLSAGRVQSAALRLIVEKEEEREAFNADEYWEFFVDVKEKTGNILRARLAKKDDKKYIPENEKEVKELEKTLGNSKYFVKEVKTKAVKRHAYPAFTTSTLQQAANNMFGYTAKRTMGIAQALYQKGYITYMRTDSVNLSNKAISAIRDQIKNKYGEEYLPEKPNYYKNKSKGAQEAHEAIRPSDFAVSKARIKEEFGEPEAKLYDLIWRRAVASQMAEKKAEVLTVSLVPQDVKNPEYIFTLGGEKTLFDGFKKIWGTSKNEDLQEIEKIKEGDVLDKKEFITEQKFTQPPARYTEASLVKKLEALGIGRPSTYATIISTIQARKYVEKDGKALFPTDTGRVVTNLLRDNFERLVNYEYTANVENKLDDISEGKVEYAPFIDGEYKPLIKEIKKAEKDVNKEDVVILGKSDEKCPDCGGEMVVRVGRYGKFLSCAKFPECKGMKDLDGGEENMDFEKYHKPEECPECKGPLKLKNGKYGKFWACENYPECKGTVPLLLNEKCPECKHHLVERRGKWGRTFIGCSNYPNCTYIKKTPKKKKEE
jgi:DNA topoisomerase-1